MSNRHSSTLENFASVFGGIADRITGLEAEIHILRANNAALRDAVERAVARLEARDTGCDEIADDLRAALGEEQER